MVSVLLFCLLLRDGRQVLAACKLAKQEIVWYCQHSAQGSVRTLRLATIDNPPIPKKLSSLILPAQYILPRHYLENHRADIRARPV